jgi:tetratricopeptide (TPR) repeat protein
MALCAAALIVYAGAFHGDFQYDDSLTILSNSHLQNKRTFIGHLDHMVRPVLSATFLIDRSLYGPNPAGYHLLNVLFHLASGFLVYRILAQAVTPEQSLVPFWTALLFLVHPIATETVTYISGRASGLMTLLYLFAFFLYIKASDKCETVPRRCYLVGAVVCFLLAIGSKETAVTLPLILLLWDVLIRGLNGPAFRSAIVSCHSPFWFILLLAMAWAWSHPRYMALAQFSFGIRPVLDNLLTQVHALAFAILLMFAPWNQNFDHDLPVFHSPTQWPLPLDLMLLSGALASGMLLSRRLPLVTFGLAWFFIQMLPTSVIPRNDLLSERNLYLASIGFLLAMVALGSHLARLLQTIIRRPALVQYGSSALAASLVFFLCISTYQRNLLYQDRLLLWSDAVAKSPKKARPHNNLGYAYALHDNWDRAIEEFRTAARLDPDFIQARENLRDAYLQRVGRQ